MGSVTNENHLDPSFINETKVTLASVDETGCVGDTKAGIRYAHT